MARYIFVVYTNPVAGREAEYNDWYDHRHLDDLRNVPGVVSARRFDLCSKQMIERPQQHKYLALYEVEADEIQPFIDAMNQRSNTELMQISPALAPDADATLWVAR